MQREESSMEKANEMEKIFGYWGILRSELQKKVIKMSRDVSNLLMEK